MAKKVDKQKKIIGFRVETSDFYHADNLCNDWDAYNTKPFLTLLKAFETFNAIKTTFYQQHARIVAIYKDGTSGTMAPEEFMAIREKEGW